MPPKTPSKRWRVETNSATGPSSVDYGSERKAYDAIIGLATSPGTVVNVGDRITVHHWERGQWVLWERIRITENGWEPA
jgi:hypothetical protein